MKGFTAAVKNNSFEIQINVESLAPLLKDSCQMLAVELRSERDVEESLNSHLRIVSHPLRCVQKVVLPNTCAARTKRTLHYGVEP